MASRGQYDILVVGAGLFGSVIAHEAIKRGMRVLVIERAEYLGGMCRTFQCEGIVVHAYGPHILHVNSDDVWNYVSGLVQIEPCMISPVARFGNRSYSLPFNMNTFNQLWGAVTPSEARACIECTRVPNEHPSNLEEHVLNMVGADIYETLVRGYVEKQYGKPCSQLPPSIISRMPLLFVYDNDYCHTRHQGIPVDGFDRLFKRLLEGCDVRVGVDYLRDRDQWDELAEHVVFTGQIDELFAYRFGPLEYRGRRFEHDVFDEENRQGAALVNYTDAAVPELRTIEHRHFVPTIASRTVVTREYATDWHPGETPYYPIDDETNRKRYDCYRALIEPRTGFHVGGRLAEYRYFDMEDTITSALTKFNKWFS